MELIEVYLHVFEMCYSLCVLRPWESDYQEDCVCKKSYSSGDFKQQRTSAYNCTDALSVNCEQDWKYLATVQVRFCCLP